MKPWLTSYQKEGIKSAHEDGMTNRRIAEKVKCHSRTVAYWMKKFGLKTHGYCRQPLKIVSKNIAECSKCKKALPLTEFLFNRKGQRYEYRFTYCLACRRNQLHANLNSSPEKFLRHKWTSTKFRAKKIGVKFTISWKEFLKQFQKQRGLCFYTDTPMRFVAGAGKDYKYSLSIDKIIPRRGYVKGNIVFCVNRVNASKTNFSLAEIKLFMPGWYQRLVDGGFVIDGNF